MKNLFTAHPNAIGETYWQHLRAALVFGSKMLVGGTACLVHAFFPFLFEKTASKITLALAEQFAKRRDQTG